MEYKILGRTGVKVSSFCLGTDNFADPTPEKESIQILETAIDAGINLLDTGDVYADGEGERIIQPPNFKTFCTIEHVRKSS